MEVCVVGRGCEGGVERGRGWYVVIDWEEVGESKKMVCFTVMVLKCGYYLKWTREGYSGVKL